MPAWVFRFQLLSLSREADRRPLPCTHRARRARHVGGHGSRAGAPPRRRDQLGKSTLSLPISIHRFGRIRSTAFVTSHQLRCARISSAGTIYSAHQFCHRIRSGSTPSVELGPSRLATVSAHAIGTARDSACHPGLSSYRLRAPCSIAAGACGAVHIGGCHHGSLVSNDDEGGRDKLRGSSDRHCPDGALFVMCSKTAGVTVTGGDGRLRLSRALNAGVATRWYDGRWTDGPPLTRCFACDDIKLILSSRSPPTSPKS